MVYVLLGTGFEETEAIAPVDLMRRAGISVQTVGLNGKTIAGGHGIAVVADITPEEMDLAAMEMLVLPGGLGGVASIRASKEAQTAIAYAKEHGKFLAAICAGPTILGELGILDNRNAVCYPGCERGMGKAVMLETACVQDGNFITGASAGCAVPFGLALVAALKGEQASKTVAEQIVIR